MPTALLSVYDKDGIVEFADELVTMGWQILASGGTAKFLEDGDIPVRDVAEIVGGRAILGHRVVTLSREIHAGLLARPEDRDELYQKGIPWIDLVCVDMYPLRDAITAPDATLLSVIESTDIGGPTLLRSAAKGNRIVVCKKSDRPIVIQWLRDGRPTEHTVINALAAKAERIVAEYCLDSARYRSNGCYDGIIGTKVRDCVYGENRWQSPAALFKTENDDPLALHRFQHVEGNLPSFINDRDLGFRELQTITHIAAAMDKNFGHVPHIAVGVKHGNPCGASMGTTPQGTIERMILGDPRAIFGGMVITNFRITAEIARILRSSGTDARRILDGVAAPSFDDEAVEILKRKGGKCRLFANHALADINAESLDTADMFVPVRGGFLRQPNYTYVIDLKDPELSKAGFKVPDESDLVLGREVGATSNSNTVTLVKDRMVIGNGVGQQDRVGACELAIKRARDAGHSTRGSIAYSDSFFPFPDGVAVLADAGITAILTTSGSVNDDKVRAFCAQRGVSLIQISDALARGFFGH